MLIFVAQTNYMNHNQATEVAPEERSERVMRELSRKRNSSEKFRNVTEMRRQLNAVRTLHAAGYNVDSLRKIASEFQESQEFAMKEILDMSSEMEKLTNM